MVNLSKFREPIVPLQPSMLLDRDSSSYNWQELSRVIRSLPESVVIIAWNSNVHADETRVTIEMGPIVIADFEVDYERLLLEGNDYIQNEIRSHIEDYKTERHADVNWEDYFE